MSDVLEAAAMRCRTMADGSLRIECEIEPRHAQAAFAMFGMPGAPMAITALKVGYATKSDETIEEPNEPPKGGPLAKLAGMWCQSKEFREWCGAESPEDARQTILDKCGINSRAELDHNRGAAEEFHLIRKQYAEWLKDKGRAACTT